MQKKHTKQPRAFLDREIGRSFHFIGVTFGKGASKVGVNIRDVGCVTLDFSSLKQAQQKSLALVRALEACDETHRKHVLDVLTALAELGAAADNIILDPPYPPLEEAAPTEKPRKNERRKRTK